MRKKTYTEDCAECDFAKAGKKIDDFTMIMICNWGKKEKQLMDPLGKKALKCKLKR